jgi:hypothetical protein
MKKHMYHVELAVKDFEKQEKINGQADWMHMCPNLGKLAKFVFGIVAEIPGDWNQRKITLLRVTRYTHNEAVKNQGGKDFFCWNFASNFEEVALRDINKFKINSKNEKKFIKELVNFWKKDFDEVDRRYKKLFKK